MQITELGPKKEVKSKCYGWKTERERNALAENLKYLIFYNLMWEGKNYFDKKRYYIQKPSQRNNPVAGVKGTPSRRTTKIFKVHQTDDW